jgi:ubiquinone/menaquinone biosynthesis C-methylase UbiE
MRRLDSEYPMGIEIVLSRWKNSNVLRKIYHRWFEGLKRDLGFEKGQRVLEIGCGCGLFAGFLDGSDVEYVGLDLLPEVIEAAPKKSGKNRFLVSSAESIPFRDGYFDSVVCIDVLHHVDYKSAISEISRVLKVGGKIGVVEPAMTFAGRNIRRLFHHENILNYPKTGSLRETLEMNGLVFEKQEFSDALAYPLSGGFSHKELIPFGWDIVFFLDGFLSGFVPLCWKYTLTARKTR